jgi:trk system potassium uptake protein TrkA
MGCGRVGSSVADGLYRIGHDVAVIDRDSAAFNRLSPEFDGDRVLGQGFDRDVLLRAGIEGADAFAAVSSGDNSNIISARLARETFGVRRVVARIYDAKRAEVYERLGIPTIATVPWTTDRLLNALTQETETAKWRDPTGTVAVAQVVLHEDWVGRRATDLEQATGARVAFLIRFGTGILPEPKTVRELVANKHDVTLIERNADHLDTDAIPAAHWLLGDACELSLLEQMHLEDFDVVVAATGDDKVNVVLSLLAKTEFAVPRVVARVNDPRNEWLFTDAWGVDVAVSTPRMLASLIEEAVAVGDLVRLMEFRKGQANLVEITLPDDTPWGGKPVRKLQLPRDVSLVTILRGPRVIVPEGDEPLEGGDELLFVAVTEAEEELRKLLLPTS